MLDFSNSSGLFCYVVRSKQCTVVLDPVGTNRLKSYNVLSTQMFLDKLELALWVIFECWVYSWKGFNTACMVYRLLIFIIWRLPIWSFIKYDLKLLFEAFWLKTTVYLVKSALLSFTILQACYTVKLNYL